MPERAFSRRWRDAVMIARLAAPYFVTAALKRQVSLTRLARWAWLRPCGPRDLVVEERALRCVVRVRTWFRAERGDCLHGSLALYRVLSRAGSNPKLLVGFRREGPAVAGHAWVEIDGRCVVEAPPTLRGFVCAFAFGPEGQLLLSTDPTDHVAM